MHNNTFPQSKQTAQPQPPANNSPELAQSLHQQFLELFPHRWKAIVKGVRPNDTWKTLKYKLSDPNLLNRWQQRDLIVGVRFGEWTRYLMLDIDKNSPYHKNTGGNPREICQCLEQIGLCEFVPVRSSESGGLHIYFPLPEPVKSFDLACLVKQTLEKSGYPVKAGQLEIFPNQKSYGSYYAGHRLPLQSGSWVLNSVNLEDEEIRGLTLQCFLNQMSWSARRQDIDQLQTQLSQVIRPRSRSNEAKISNKAEAWLKDLKARIEQGWTGNAQTNELILEIGKLGKVFGEIVTGAILEAENLAEWMAEKLKSLPGYIYWCAHQHEIYQRCLEWVSATEKSGYYLRYRAFPERLKRLADIWKGCEETIQPKANLNQIKAQKSLERLHSCLRRLDGEIFPSAVALFKKINSKAQEMFGQAFSKSTFQKYSQLWQHKLVQADVEGDSAPKDTETAPSPQKPETPTQQSCTDDALYEGVFCCDSPEVPKTEGNLTPEENQACECDLEDLASDSVQTTPDVVEAPCNGTAITINQECNPSPLPPQSDSELDDLTGLRAAKARKHQKSLAILRDMIARRMAKVRLDETSGQSEPGQIVEQFPTKD